MASSSKDLNGEPNKYGLYFTKVSGIDDQKYNGSTHTIHLDEILSSRFGQLKESIQFNFMIDLDWLVDQYQPSFRQCPMTLVMGNKPEYTIPLQECIASDPSLYNHVRLCPARLDIPYGTHHTKMMLLLYEEGLRVVISTANLVPKDWHQKTQMVWISPMFKASTQQSKFQDALCTYLLSYRALPVTRWVQIVKDHDCSPENVHFVASSPGRYIGDDILKFGHMRLREVLLKNFRHTSPPADKPDHIIGQFSSIGSLGNTQSSWLCSEWLDSLRSQLDETFVATPKCILDRLKSPPKSAVSLKLIYPTVNEVYESLEGLAAGDSLPHTAALAMKQPWFKEFLHHWKSDHLGRSRAMPHVKTYTRITSDQMQCLWFLVTSANLSKAAWGFFEKQGTQLMIRSYEAGVLIIPDPKKPPKLPYDLPLIKYTKSDEPWVCDAVMKLSWSKRRLVEEENIQKSLDLQKGYSVAARNLSAAINQDPKEIICEDEVTRVRSPGRSSKFFKDFMGKAKSLARDERDKTSKKEPLDYIDLT